MIVGPELVFGLVGAVGTDLAQVGVLLMQGLQRVAYTSERVRLSDLLLECHAYGELKAKIRTCPEDERINELMKAGDELRRQAQRGDALVLLAIARMRDLRLREVGQEKQSRPRHAFILHSLKHPKEVATLRAVYGDAFVNVAVYMPRARRRQILADRFKKSRKAFDSGAFEPTADALIAKDEKELGDDLGQNVRDTFPESDVFLDASDASTLPQQVSRVIEILFRHPQRTPTVDEVMLFHAKAAALRSGDLSRQVGAAIATPDGEIIATGCNEVPKAGGGSVWEGREDERKKDNRDFAVGHDSSARMKHEILTEIFSRLRDGKWLREDLRETEPSELVDQALSKSSGGFTLAGTRAASIIEFGRMVHAEMSALMEAARRGLVVKKARLYCTTFPCHMCARHIVAAGIDEVVYIEPYPKSMAKDLYRRSISVDHDDAEPGAVQFRPFVGIAPSRYISFFEMPTRKDDRGHVIEWAPTTALPRVRQFVTYLEVEAIHTNLLSENRFVWNIVAEEPSP